MYTDHFVFALNCTLSGPSMAFVCLLYFRIKNSYTRAVKEVRLRGARIPFGRPSALKTRVGIFSGGVADDTTDDELSSSTPNQW